MTPKEKAKELFDRIGKEISRPIKSGGYRFNVNHAKQCALIAVDEIISIEKHHMHLEWTNYWQQVKQEIEKL